MPDTAPPARSWRARPRRPLRSPVQRLVREDGQVVHLPLPLAEIIDQPWRADALCAQSDPDTWFPPVGGDPTPAKRICARCPVQPECLRHAIDAGETHGVWGGLTTAERARLVRKENAA